MRWMQKERPFMFWLVVVQLAAVLPLLGFAALLTDRLVVVAGEEQVARLEQKVSATADAVAREADRVRTRLQLLASQDAALAGDAAAVRRLAVRLMASDQVIAGVSAIDPTGQLVFTTYRPEGFPLPRIALPPGAAPVFERDESYVSGLTPAGIDGVLLIGFAVPWRVEGKTRYALRMALKPAALGELLREQRWPQTWTAALVDQHMKVVARTRDEDKYFGQAATASLQEFIKARGAGVGYSRTLDGVEMITAVAQVRGTPWRVAAGLPRAALQAQAEEPMRALLAGGLAFVLFGIALSYALSRKLNRDFVRAVAGRSAGTSKVTEFRSLEIQRLMLDNELVGMVRVRDRRSVWHNRALEKIFGYLPGELEGHSPRLMHVSQEVFEAFGREAYGALADGQAFRRQLEMVCKGGRRIWVDVSGILLGEGEALWMIVDISALKADHARVELLAFHDGLTGLPNRALLDVRMQQAMAAARRSGQIVALCFLDLNGFKAVNDAHGHAAGDAVLVAIAGRLTNAVKAHDTVARVGGDEFVIVLTNLDHIADVEAVLRRVRRVVAEPVLVDGGACAVGVAIGVALFPRDEADDVERLQQLADQRMYSDKLAARASALG